MPDRESTRQEPARIDPLVAARAGDEGAFATLTQPFQRELHVHCYRMLGSLDDADDALQETRLRAWRALDRFEPRAPFRAWLYRIATNVCLTMLAQRSRRGEVLASSLLAGRDGDFERVTLDPYPDRLLDETVSIGRDPQATVEQWESVELAFVAAVQVLPPRQRATLLLRDVMGYSAKEVAAMLETSSASINSAHQRARSTLAHERATGRIARAHSSRNPEVEQLLVRRLIDAWHSVDVASIVAVLTEDALLTMPPQPERYVGRDEIAAFLSTVPGDGRLDRFHLLPTRANRQPALAAYYREGGSGDFHPHGIFVLGISEGAIASFTRLNGSGFPVRFDLPSMINGD